MIFLIVLEFRGWRLGLGIVFFFEIKVIFILIYYKEVSLSYMLLLGIIVMNMMLIMCSL